MRAYIYAAILGVAMLFGAGLTYQVTKARAERAEVALAASKAEAKGLRDAAEARDLADAVREKQRAKVAAQTKENHANLEEALKANRAWADEPVPDAVADSLRRAAQQAQPQPAQRGAVRN